MSMTLLVYDPDAHMYAQHLRGLDANTVVLEANDPADALKKISSVDGLVAFGNVIDETMISAATKLKWVQVLSSGTDSLLRLNGLKPDVIVTSAAGVHGPMVSEMAMLLMLAASRRLPQLLRQQASAEWLRVPGDLLARKTVGIAGVGTIGRALAVKCKAFDMRVIGFGGTVRPEPLTDAFYRYEDLAGRAGELDFLVLLAPLRSETVNLVDQRVLTAMKRNSVLVNVGRGKTVNEADLVAALLRSDIGMAALDAHVLEPLPETSPLWRLDNVIVTPHVGGHVVDYAAHVIQIIAHNFLAILRGDAESLINRVSRVSRQPGNPAT